ncbi:MAG: hypothetical protein CVU44_19255 [Chloroflexi bacterium HGW-Chloroflexi-6]|nr:MAG: hypothetical protein CVU44_19255 [Chloroflexi bacterium HGW-Chloroflexi-6]
MQIIETSVFTRRMLELLADDDYRLLQSMLIVRPEAGAIIPGSGGLRKLRWAASGHGKRGGARIIYYWYNQREQLLMLYIYPKNEQDDLTAEQLRALKKIVEREYP